jgi:hypothetical protein
MLRELTREEVGFVSGGTDPDADPIAVVIGSRNIWVTSVDADDLADVGIFTLGSNDLLNNDLLNYELQEAGFFTTADDKEREEIFIDVVKALLPPGTPGWARTAIANLVADARNAMLNAVSLENKAAADRWINANAQAFANWGWHRVMGAPEGVDPIEAFQAVFGAPDVDLDWI